MDVTLQPVTSQSIQVTWKVSEVRGMSSEMPASLLSPGTEPPRNQATGLWSLITPLPAFAQPSKAGGEEREEDEGPRLHQPRRPPRPGSLLEALAWGGKELAVPRSEEGPSPRPHRL